MNEDDDDESEDDEDIDEELGYISPLENVNPYISFKQALTSTFLCLDLHDTSNQRSCTAFQMQNAPSYQTATTSLDIEAQTLLMEVMRIAEQDPAQVAQS